MLPFVMPEISHSRAVLSSDPDSTRAPSGLKATEVTEPSCPLKARISFPVAASHRRAVLSPDPVSTRAPSGLKATEVTNCSCPLKARISSPVDDWNERSKLRPLRFLAAHVPGRRRIAIHLGDRLPAQSENPCRLAPA